MCVGLGGLLNQLISARFRGDLASKTTCSASMAKSDFSEVPPTWQKNDSKDFGETRSPRSGIEARFGDI